MGGFSVYGLGILLTLEDKVSDKIGGVSNSLQNLSMKAMSLNYMGKSLMNTGKALLSPIVGLSKEVIRVGDDVDKARITFGALYDDATLGAEKFNEVIKYAASTPFDVESLKDAALQFKTLGVELFGTNAMVTDATGETRQLIDIIGDAGAGLSGVARNGFKDVVYATREFITEGNKLSFLRRLGVDIDAVLEKGIKADNVMKELSLSAGETVEERKVAYANLIKALNMDGLMEDMEGTWSQVMSNMDDIWYLFMMKVGDKGSFKVFKEAFKGISDTMKALLDTDVADKFCDSVSMALESVTRPLDIGIKKLMGFVEQFVRLGAEHPNIIKLAFSITSLAGVLFILAGAGLVAQGSMLILGHGLAVIASLLPKALLLAGLFAVIKTAWTKDIGGIKTRLTGFVNTVRTSFSKAREILALSTDDMIKSYNDLVEQYSNTGDFGAGLTAGIIRTAKLWGAFVDFWNDSTLSQENLKILNEMGIMPMFEKIATWTEKFKAFFKGVTEGFSEMANAVGDFVNSIMAKFFPTLETGNGQGLFDTVTGKFNGGDLSGVENMGKTAMKLLPTVLGLIKIAKLIHKHNNSGRNGGGITGLLSRILGGRGNNPDGGDTGGVISSLRRLGNTLASLNPVQVLRGLGNLSLILGGLSILTLIVGGIASVNPSVFAKGALAIASLCLVLRPISTPTFDTAIDSMKRLAKFKAGTFLKGIKNLGTIFTAMSIVTMIVGGIVGVSPAAFIAGGVAVTAMGYMFTAIGNPAFIASVKGLQKLAGIKPTEILKGLGNLAIILGGMAALFVVLGLVSLIPFDYGRIAKMALVIGLLGVVGAALAGIGDVVGHFSVSHTIGGFIAMSAALLAMTGLLLILGAVSLIPFDYGRIAKLALVIGLLGVIGLALVALSAGAGGIALLGGGMGAVAIIAGMIAIGLVLTAMSALMVLINWITSGLNLDRVDSVISLILKVGAIGTALTVLSAISGVVAAPALVGIASIGIVVSSLAGLAVLFSNFESKAEQIQSGLNVMAQIGAGIGKAIGSFIGGIGEGISNSLPVIGNNISSFMSSISTVPVPSEGQQSIGDFLSSLGEGLVKITAGNILSAFTGGNSLAKVGSELNAFSTSAKTAFDNFAQYPDAGVEKAPKIMDSLKGIGAYSFRSGGLAQLFTGEVGLSNIGNELSSFSTSAKTAFDNFANFSDTGIEKLPKIFEAMKGIGDYDFKTGGLSQLITGDTSISKIGSQLYGFSTSAKLAFDEFANFSDTGITKLPQIFESMKGLGNYNFKSGGLGQLITGDTDISKVGKKLSKFADSAKTAFDTFAEFPELGIGKLPRIFNAISGIGTMSIASYESLPDIGNKLDDFSKKAKSAFDCFAEFSAEGFSSVTNMSSVLQGLSEVLNGSFIPSVDVVSTSLSTLSTTLTVVSEYFATLYVSAILAGSGVVSAGIMIVTGMAMIVGVSTSGIALIIVAFTLLGQRVLQSAVVVTTGMMLMYVGVQTNCSLIISAIANMSSTVRGQLSSLASSGYSYGSRLASSIAAGISGNSGAIRAAVQSAISSAVSSATIKIPSVKVGHNALGTSNWAGGLTEINERGGEIVDLPRGTRIYPHDDSVTMAFDEGMRTAIDSMRGSSYDHSQHDNSINFSAGSIVVQVANASEAEAERFAELIMQKIEKKKRRKAIATYAY